MDIVKRMDALQKLIAERRLLERELGAMGIPCRPEEKFSEILERLSPEQQEELRSRLERALA